MLSRLQSGGLDVDDDYPRCAGDARAAHGVKADAACAEDHDCVACLHVGGVDDRARARNDAAPEQRRLRERHVVWEEGKLVLVDEGAFCETAQSQNLEQTYAISAEAGPLSRAAHSRFGMLALEGTARLAPCAGAAGWREPANDGIADLELRNVGTHLRDDPRNLVTKHRWAAGQRYVWRTADRCD